MIKKTSVCKATRSKDLFLFIAGILVMLTCLYELKNNFLSCSDSIADYISAQSMTFGEMRQMAKDFSLSRGKTGFVFPFIVAIRMSICKTENYTYIWLMQYAPIVLNVYILTGIVMKKVSGTVGLTLPIIFFSFLQYTPWHNILICYPLDFMFGLTMILLSFILFDIGIRLEGKFLKVCSLILSSIFYFISMESYEAFLLLGIIHFVLLLFYIKEISIPPKMKIKRVILLIALPLVAALIFAAVVIAIRLNPNVEHFRTGDVSSSSMKYVPITLISFSGGLLPLSSMVFRTVRGYFTEVSIDVFDVIRTILTSISVGVLLSEINRNKTKIRQKLTNIWLLVLVGIIGAIIFPFFHSISANYQDWVINGHQLGYVPTFVSYYGWILAILLIGVRISYSILKKLDRSKKLFTVVIALIVGIITLATSMINNVFDSYSIGAANKDVSLRAQIIYLMANDENEEFKSLGCDLLYCPGFFGIHGSSDYVSNYLNNEFDSYGKDNEIRVTNNIEDFIYLMEGSNKPYALFYDYKEMSAYYSEVVGVGENNELLLSETRHEVDINRLKLFGLI